MSPDVFGSAHLVALLVTAQAGMSAPPLVEAEVSTAPAFERVGFAFDLGVPEGLGAAVALRPWSWAQLSFGPATNGAAFGVRGGVSISPLRTFVRPTLSAHAGHFGEGDASAVAELFVGDDFRGAEYFRRVRYDFVSAHLGVEIGQPDGTSFFLRGGMSRAWVQLNGFEAALQHDLNDAALTATAPRLELTIPSVQAGLLFFIY